MWDRYTLARQIHRMISSLTPLHRGKKFAVFQPVTCCFFCEKSRGNDVLHQLSKIFIGNVPFGNLWSTTTHHWENHHQSFRNPLGLPFHLFPKKIDQIWDPKKNKTKNSPSTLSPKKRPQAVKGLFLRQEKRFNPFSLWEKKRQKWKMKTRNGQGPLLP